MDLKTHNTVRGSYYLGIVLLIMYVMPITSDYLAPIFNKEVLSGMTIIMLIAAATAVGAIMAFKRKL